eukprot:gnl/MRDRNA2_/MRDRNA2_94870_c0_seq1.p1 gnl/MRDRNA2_/MRDRNA2_94870_c0~~gnl/MRDRNA2_/MRDRNA2_94870_c0_seq1.p1  ORF type:complete len:1613 (-),score=246.37 gnl/MRDRNA2_/MRDRNA2_94870_c0_seq1:37-4875(-)
MHFALILLRALLIFSFLYSFHCSSTDESETAFRAIGRFLSSSNFQNSNESNYSTQVATSTTITFSTTTSNTCTCLCNISDYAAVSSTLTSSPTTTTATTSTVSSVASGSMSGSSFDANSTVNESNTSELVDGTQGGRRLTSLGGQNTCPDCICNVTESSSSPSPSAITSTSGASCMPPVGYFATALGCAGSQTEHGGNCTLTCEPGYMKSGDFYCSDGNWQLPLPTCTASPCSTPPTLPSNATGTYDHCIGTLSDAFCALTCKTGYTKSGNFACKNGVFDAPICIPPCVTEPPVPEFAANNESVGCTLPVTHGGKCILECMPGYSKTSDFACSSGAFSSARCEPDCTQPPPLLDNAYNSPCSVPASTGSTCELVCAGGFMKSGDFVCSGGSWMSTPVECVATTTTTTPGPPTAPPPKLLSIESTNEFQELITLIFDCRVRVCPPQSRGGREGFVAVNEVIIEELCPVAPVGCADVLTVATMNKLGIGAVCSWADVKNQSVLNVVLGDGSDVLPGDEFVTLPGVLFRDAWLKPSAGSRWRAADYLTARVPAGAGAFGMPTARISLDTPVSGPCSTVLFSSKRSTGGRLVRTWTFGAKTPQAIRTQLQDTLNAANASGSAILSFSPEEFHAAVKALREEYEVSGQDFTKTGAVLQVQVTVSNRNGRNDSASAEVPIPTTDLSRLGSLCECAPGFFGQDCSSECVCDPDGTTSCDDGRTGTGTCQCKPTFGGNICDEKLSWRTGQWSECGPCGLAQGSQSRSVWCEWSSGQRNNNLQWSCGGTEPYASRTCVPNACPCSMDPPEIPNGDIVASNSLCGGTESGTDCVGACKPGFEIYGSYKCTQGRWVSWPRCIKEGVEVETMTAFRSFIAFGGLEAQYLEDLNAWVESAGPAFRTVLSQWIRGMSGPTITEEDVVIEKAERQMHGGRRILSSTITIQMHFVVLLRDTSVASSVRERLMQVAEHDIVFVAAMREELVKQCASCALPSSVAMESPLLTEVTLAVQDVSRKTTSSPSQEVRQDDDKSSASDLLVPVLGLCAGLVCSCLGLFYAVWRRRSRTGGQRYSTKITEASVLDPPHTMAAKMIIPLAEDTVASGLPSRALQTTIARLRLPLADRLTKYLELQQKDVDVVALEVAGAFLHCEIRLTARTEASASSTKHEFQCASRRFWPGHSHSLAGLEDCVKTAAEKVRLELRAGSKISIVFQGTQDGATPSSHRALSKLKYRMASLSSKLYQAKASLGPPPPPMKLRVPGLGVAASSAKGKWGTQTMADGSEYQGELTSGVRQGLGRQVSADGTVYIGNFKDDLPHGDGSIQWVNGQSYAGQWVKGRVEGHGLLQACDEWIYNGQFRDNLRHGIGRCEWIQSDQWYEGDWKDGIEDGIGEAGKDVAMASANGNCPKTAQLWSWKEGVREESLCTVSVAPGSEDKLLLVALGEAVIDPHGWLTDAERTRMSSGGDAFAGAEEMVPDDPNAGQWEVPQWGFSFGHPNLWIPGRWGALVLTRIAENGRLAQWNQSLKEIQKSAEVAETNALIWAVDGFRGDANRMASMLLEKGRRGIVLELKNPSSSSCPTLRANLKKRTGWWNSSQFADGGRVPWKSDAPPPPPMPAGMSAFNH